MVKKTRAAIRPETQACSAVGGKLKHHTIAWAKEWLAANCPQKLLVECYVRTPTGCRSCASWFENDGSIPLDSFEICCIPYETNAEVAALVYYTGALPLRRVKGSIRRTAHTIVITSTRRRRRRSASRKA